MFFFSFWSEYLVWHYSSALVGYVRIWRNLWWFLVQKFSLPELIHSLFAPYKRITETRAPDFDIEAWASVIIINLMSRLVGFIIRASVIIVGVLFLTLYTVAGLVSYFIWIGAPLIIICSLIGGVFLWLQ